MKETIKRKKEIIPDIKRSVMVAQKKVKDSGAMATKGNSRSK